MSSSAAALSIDLTSGTATGDGTDTLVLAGRVLVLGSNQDDVILGSDGPDTIAAMGGSDLVRGGGGDDTIANRFGGFIPGRGDDRFFGGPGDDVLYPGRHDDLVRGGKGDDWIEDLWGVIDADGGPGNDWIAAALEIGASHVVSGGSGRDGLVFDPEVEDLEEHDISGTVDVPAGQISMIVDGVLTSVAVSGISGWQTPIGHWTFLGSAGPDYLLAHSSAEARTVAWMRRGDDSVQTGDGDDTLYGGRGRDTVYPRGGRDTCRGFEVVDDEDPCEVSPRRSARPTYPGRPAAGQRWWPWAETGAVRDGFAPATSAR